MKRGSTLLKSCFLSILCLCLMDGIISAQVRTVTGTVTSEEAEPLPGVSVMIHGTTKETFTDDNGNYSIEISGPDAVLEFTFAGLATQARTAGMLSVIDVVLVPDLTHEIVITAYALQKKQDLTGSVVIVKPEELIRMPQGNVTQQLQGRIAGVTVTQDSRPGKAAKVRIRGFGSFENNSPLYIVDGIPTTDISILNPLDIESLTVLKDAGAASIYGVRASNGVIVITTRGGQQGINVSYNMYAGTQRPGPGPDFLLNTREYMNLQQLIYDNDGAFETHPVYGPSGNLTLPYWAANTNWWDEVMRNAPVMNHDLSLSGGHKSARFYTSIGYFNQDGTVIENWFKRWSARFNSDFIIRERITIGENLNITHRSGNEIDANGSEYTALMNVYRQQSIIPVKWDSGTFYGYGQIYENGDWGGTGIAPRLGSGFNYVANRTRDKDDRWQDVRLLGNMYADVKILEGLNFRTSFGGSMSGSYSTNWTGKTYEGSENIITSTYSESSSYGADWTWTTTLTFAKQFGNHNILAVGGYEAVKIGIGRSVITQRAGYFSEEFSYRTVSNGATLQFGGSSFYTPRTLLSQFIRADYNFRGRYYLSGSVRRDGASVFGPETRYGVFPSVSAGWRIIKESSLDGLSLINDLKVRGGYGMMGNQLSVATANRFNVYDGSITTSYYDISGTTNSAVQGFRPTKIGNEEVKWETNVTTNVGIDAILLDNRLEVCVDWYTKQNKDLLFLVDLPGIYGTASGSYVNVGKMNNRGIDLQMTYRHNWSDLSLEATAQFTTYHNEIVKIADGVLYFDAGGSRIGSFNRNMTGEALGSFFGFKVLGLFRNDEEVSRAPKQDGAEPGFFRYENVENTGNSQDLIDWADRTIIGSPNPDFTCGLNLLLKKKSFDLTAFFYGIYGNDIFNYNRWWLDFWPSFQGQKSKDLLYKSWTPSRKNTTVPKASNSANFSTNTVSNSYYIEDGSYIRLKNLQIGYTLPGSFAGKVFSHARIYVQVVNLRTITKYSGMDPELASFYDTFMGVDEGNLPSPRQFLVGVNIGF